MQLRSRRVLLKRIKLFRTLVQIFVGREKGATEGATAIAAVQLRWRLPLGDESSGARE